MGTLTQLGLTERAIHNQWTTSQTNYSTSTRTFVTDEELQATDQSYDRLHDDDDDDDEEEEEEEEDDDNDDDDDDDL